MKIILILQESLSQFSSVQVEYLKNKKQRHI